MVVSDKDSVFSQTSPPGPPSRPKKRALSTGICLVLRAQGIIFAQNIYRMGFFDIFKKKQSAEAAPEQAEQQREELTAGLEKTKTCLLYTSPSPRDLSTSRMPSSA